MEICGHPSDLQAYTFRHPRRRQGEPIATRRSRKQSAVWLQRWHLTKRVRTVHTGLMSVGMVLSQRGSFMC